MNINLGRRAVAVLAFVAATTVAIVKPELIGGTAQPQSMAALTVVALSHF